MWSHGSSSSAITTDPVDLANFRRAVRDIRDSFPVGAGGGGGWSLSQQLRDFVRTLSQACCSSFPSGLDVIVTFATRRRVPMINGCFPYVATLADLSSDVKLEEVVRYLKLASATLLDTRQELCPTVLEVDIATNNMTTPTADAMMRAVVESDACRRLVTTCHRFADVVITLDQIAYKTSTTLPHAHQEQQVPKPSPQQLTLSDLCATLCSIYNSVLNLCSMGGYFTDYFAGTEMCVRLGGRAVIRVQDRFLTRYADGTRFVRIVEPDSEDDTNPHGMVTTRRTLHLHRPFTSTDTRSKTHHCMHPLHGVHDSWVNEKRRAREALMELVAATEAELRAALDQQQGQQGLEFDLRFVYNAKGALVSQVEGALFEVLAHATGGCADDDPLRYLVGKIQEVQDREETPFQDMLDAMPVEDMIRELQDLHGRLLSRGGGHDNNNNNDDACADALLGEASSAFLRALWEALWVLSHHRHTSRVEHHLVTQARERIDRGRDFLRAIYGLDSVTVQSMNVYSAQQ
jgi:hypothetical protein